MEPEEKILIEYFIKNPPVAPFKNSYLYKTSFSREFGHFELPFELSEFSFQEGLFQNTIILFGKIKITRKTKFPPGISNMMI